MSTTTATRRTSRSTAAAQLLGVSVVTNLALFAVGTLLGAAMAVDNNGAATDVGIIEVTLASIIPLALATGVYAWLAQRIDLVRRAWTPTVAVLTLLSLGAMTGAQDLTTALVLGTMHLVVGGLAAVALPSRLGR